MRLPCAFAALLLLSAGNLAPIAAEEPLTIRVLSYNIDHGLGTDGKTDIGRAARVIADAKPDLVALQQVDLKTERSGKVDQAAELGRLTKMHVVYGPSGDFDGGAYGIAILSRWPIVWSKTLPIPNVGSDMKRSLLFADVDLPGPHANLTLLSTQFDHGPRAEARNRSGEFIAQFGEVLADGPAILGADFFDVLESEPVSKAEKAWTIANAEFVPTTPANEPTEQRHFVLYRPADRFEVVEIKVLEEPVASNHRPVLATLKLLPAPKKQ
jgi:endonuclease/exonuclease/phosphatase family metal-dependent hydrolase